MVLYRGCSFNLLYGRDPAVVRRELIQLVNMYDLDFVAVQEAADYYPMLSSNMPGNYWSGTGSRPNKQLGFITRDGLKVDMARLYWYGDGWRTTTGSYSRGSGQMQIRLGGHLLMHLPTPTHWVNGKLEAPAERRDDYIAQAKALKNFFRYPATRNARLALGDWNERPTTVGQYSPSWIRRGTRSHYALPQSKAGHGSIDWVNYKGCQVTSIFKDKKVREGSDHEPVIFSVRVLR